MKKIVAFILFLVSLQIVYAETLVIKPNGQGFYSDWSNVNCGPSAEWNCVDEHPIINDNDYLSAGSNNLKESFIFSDTGFVPGTTIYDITLSYRAKRFNPSKNKMYGLVRSGGVNYLSSYAVTLSPSYTSPGFYFSTNPATGQAWTISDLNNLEAGTNTASTNGGAILSRMHVSISYTPPGTNCSETDTGADIGHQGMTYGSLNNTGYSFTDTCINSTTIREYYCNRGYALNYQINCPMANGTVTICSSGACV